MSIAVHPADSLFIFLATLTHEGYVKLSGTGTTLSMENLTCGADIANKRFSCMGSIHPTAGGRISEVYLRFLMGPSADVVAELKIVGLESNPENSVNAGGTYKVQILVVWET